MLHLLQAISTDLETWLSERGHSAWRARQVRHWLFDRRVSEFGEMTDLSKPLRSDLERDFRIWTTRVVNHRTTDDGTEKLLLELSDGHRIESVLLRDGARRTICISTQVGCAMGCVFCASGLDGVARNLTSGEIREQFLRLGRLLPAGEKLTHIVVMGMGEPLANLDELLPALASASDPRCLGISTRRITISTVGLPKAMRRLAAHDVHYHLAVSLHAADDALRTQLVPVNRQIGLMAVLEAADEYFRASGRRLTFEYVLLGGVNDSLEQARRLAKLLAPRRGLLNVIPYNPVSGLGYRAPTRKAVADFVSSLRHQGVNVQTRQRKGDRIDAACGQLRRSAASAVVEIASP